MRLFVFVLQFAVQTNAHQWLPLEALRISAKGYMHEAREPNKGLGG